MAMVTDKFVFTHLPKTGGKFFRHVIKECGIAYSNHDDFHSAPTALDARYDMLPVVITVRHPVTWYQSRWYHRVRQGWLPEHPIDWACASNDFNTFVLNVMKHDTGGRLTSLIKLFQRRSSPNSPPTCVLKTESLSEDLYRLLRFRFHYDVNLQSYNTLQRMNVSGVGQTSSSMVAMYKPEVLEQLLHHERWVINELYDGITDPSILIDQFVV